MNQIRGDEFYQQGVTLYDYCGMARIERLGEDVVRERKSH